MKKQTGFIIGVAFVLYIGLAIWLTTERNEALNEAEQAQMAFQTAIGERDNAIELAEQYKQQYNEAVFEIAELKAQNEELTQQIEELMQPPQDAYTEIGWDFDYVVRVVGAEARGEPVEGILAVCQCIQDTAERTGQTPEQVVKSGQYTKPISHSVKENMETVNECCLLVFLNGYKPFPEPIEYFYAFKNSTSAWHESQVFCYEIGGHRYFKSPKVS